MPDAAPSLGARYAAGTTTFRVWAPERTSVELLVEGAARTLPGPRPLTRSGCGYWSGSFDDVPPGAHYRYRLDGRDDSVFPDPVSRFQPEGVHGPSMVIDPSTFAWTDDAWQPPPLERLIIYELHLGTFTPQGTFRAAVEKLPYLKELGVTAIELMPVADFAGTRNWGYDGVALFAPARVYGAPDDLRALVDAAHGHGLAVILDVVYNHLGPDGAYANAFSPHYFTDRHASPWGKGVNLDGPHSSEVRRFFIENARHWVQEYHVDGLRLDATHALLDDGPVHFLAELTDTVRAHAERPVVLIAEDHRNLPHMLQPTAAGGWGLDAVWADEFHHQARVHTAHDREGYYARFSGRVEDLAATLTQSWYSRGPEQFVFCIQNHDQVGNRYDGARLHHQVDAATYRTLTTLLLLAPQTPLLFMGQEWAASSPFQYFTDHEEELGRKVTEGRREEFRDFAAFADPARRAAIPDPQAPETFMRSRLPWEEADDDEGRRMRRLYQRLLQLRPPARDVAARALDAHTLLMTVGELTAIVRLSGGGAVVVPGTNGIWRDCVLTTEDFDVTIDRMPIRIDTAAPVTVTFDRPGAIVFRGLTFAS
jgi:maltooligosyltrehalose trehalohydrolase